MSRTALLVLAIAGLLVAGPGPAALAQEGPRDAGEDRGAPGERAGASGGDRGSGGGSSGSGSGAAKVDRPGAGDDDRDGDGDGDGDDDRGDDRDDEGDRADRAKDRGLRDLARAQGDERRDFEQRQREAREACRGLRGEAREDCEDALEEDAERFRAAQRGAFEERREALRADPAGERLGRFALADGAFAGKFTTFTWNASLPGFADYAVGGCRVFSAVVLAGGGAGDDLEVEVGHRGRVVEAEAGKGRLQAHDNPGGVLNARAPGGGDVAFTLAPGITAALNGSRLALAGCANWTANLSGPGLAFAAGVARAPGVATFVAHDANPALPPAAQAHRAAVEAAKAARAVGAEVTVVGRTAGDIEEVELDGALDVHAQHTADGLRVVVNGTGTEPRTVVLNVAPGLLAGDRVVVRYFDEAGGTFREARITPAADLADVLDPTDDAGPESWVVHGPDGAQVLVSIDSWSTHAFTVQGLLEEVPPSVLAGVLGAVAFVALAGAGLLRRPRRRVR